MKTYEIQISELLCHKVCIGANSKKEALNLIANKYYNSEIVLSAEDYVDGSVQFEVIGISDNIPTDKI